MAVWKIEEIKDINVTKIYALKLYKNHKNPVGFLQRKRKPAGFYYYL